MSEVSICNQALALLGVDPITSFSDGSTQAGLCNRLYAPVRNQVLEDRAWTFATGRAELLPDAEAPAWGYSQRFKIPTTWLRILWANNIAPSPSSENTTRPLPWRKEGRYILADAEKLYVRYVDTVADTSLFSAAFSDCLAYRMAAEMAIPLTENRSLFADLQALYARKLMDAGLTDGAQGTRQEKYKGNYVLRR